MYEYFEFDIENASFEWDEEKEKQNFKNMEFILRQQQKFFWIPIN